jgi:hypothetical protein
VILVDALLTRTKVFGVRPELAMQLLDARSEVLESSFVQDESAVLRKLGLKGAVVRSSKAFLRRVDEMTPAERLECCLNIGLGGVEIASDAQVLDVFNRGAGATHKHHFATSLRTGLSSIRAWHDMQEPSLRGELMRYFAEIGPDSLPLPDTIPIFEFVPCPAFSIAPHALANGTAIERTITPALFLGSDDALKAISVWRTWRRVGEIDQLYRALAQQIRTAWLTQIPGSNVADPVYRFLATPSFELAQEAFLFLRNADVDPLVSSAAFDAVTDPITLKQAAVLVGQALQTLYNKSKDRPEPAICGGKGKADVFSYKMLRPWLMKHWPRMRYRLSENYEKTKKYWAEPTSPQQQDAGSESDDSQ